MNRRRVDAFKVIIRFIRRSYLFALVALLAVLTFTILNLYGVVSKYDDGGEPSSHDGNSSYEITSGLTDGLSSAPSGVSSAGPVFSEINAGQSSEATETSEISSEPSDTPVSSGGVIIESEYGELYTDMYFPDKPDVVPINEKTIFLTFSNSPTVNTDKILDTLKEYGVKATFFVSVSSRERDERIFNRIINEGHTIAIQSYKNNFGDVFSSTLDFLKDFNDMYSYIYELTGHKAQLYRFLGGSKSNNQKIQSVINEAYEELSQRGFICFDWSAAAFDAVYPRISSVQMISNVINTVGARDSAVVLLHDFDNNLPVVSAVDGIIEYFSGMGYSFDALSNSVEPVSFIR